MRMHALLLIGAIMIVAEVNAAPTRVSSDGHEYTLSCNGDGYVMGSLYPVVRFVGSGAATQTVTGTETLYLGRSCDAYSKSLGTGSWCWANGGFLVSFPAIQIGFPRQELYCPTQDDLGQSCVCR